MRCPGCGHENIPGSDLCESCGWDLAGLDIPEAKGGLRGALMTGRVRDIPLVPPLVLTPGASVAEAIGLMRRERHGCVLVGEGGGLLGIFTERDLLSRVVRKGRDPRSIHLGEVMTPDPYTVSPADPPAFAIHRMVAQGLRHLPVVDGTQLLGFISVRNILRYIHQDVIPGLG